MNKTVPQATILEEIIEHKLGEIAAAKDQISIAELESQFALVGSTRGFCQALRNKISAQQPAVIAEIKTASPSKGIIRQNFDPAEHAADYAANGATCLSILTDQKFFQGSNTFLRQARDACILPTIRKDFVIDPYQIAESKVLGADCILLIVAALQRSQLAELAAYANEISIDILVEVHKLVVTESGINAVEYVKTMTDNGIFGFLVGESFMRAEKPGAQLKELFFSHE